MKRKLLVLLSAIFVVSCAGNSVDQSKVANKDEVKKEAKEESSSKSKGCHANTMGSRLKRC